MGNGSPRLLGKLVARTALAAVAALVLAPHAFAGGLVPPEPSSVAATVSNASAPVQAAVQPSVPAVPAPIPAAQSPKRAAAKTVTASRSTPIAPATPVATPRLPVQTASPSGLATAVASRLTPHEPSSPAAKTTQRSARKATAATRRHVRGQAAGPLTGQSRPAGASTTSISSLQAATFGLHRLLPQTAKRPDASGSDGSQLPQPPAPMSPGAGGALNGGGAGIGLILLALMTAAAAFAPPRAKQRVRTLFAVPRPHPFLLRLERPD
jgi:hypothetical protein